MDEERLPCLTQGCTRTIQSATARRTGGYCAPCAGRRAKAEWDEYVRLNRRDVDAYAGVDDPVEIIRVKHEQDAKPHDPLVNRLPAPRSLEQLYAALGRDEADRVMKLSVEALRAGDRSRANAIALCLAAFTEYRLDPMLESWVDANHLWPALPFRRAGAVVRDRVLRLLLGGKVSPNHALQTLAWIADDVVIQRFSEWEAAPPRWTKALYVGPAHYARVAGWEPSNHGRRDLHFRDCLAIVPATQARQPDHGVRLFEPAGRICPCCGRELVDLVQVDAGDDRFSFLPIKSPRLSVLTCDLCTCFGEFVFAEMDEAGEGHWSAFNRPPAFLPRDRDAGGRSPWAGTAARLFLRRAFHAADPCLPTTFTQIGGLPAWVQDADYPTCYVCQRTMTFIAQVDNGQFPGHEGVYYAFVCARCRVTATTYQQT